MGNSSKVNRWAYPIPSNLLPDDDFCAKVYIPNGDDYRRAFLGAYTFFGSWVAWERDKEHNATVAASRFRDAIEKTIEEWGSGCCEFIDMTEEEFRELLTLEIEKMSVSVTQTVNCGCGCGGSSVSNIVDDSAPPDDYTIPPIVPPVPVTVVDNVDKCDRANYLVVSFRNAVLTLSQGVEGSFTDFGDWFDGIVGWLVGHVPLSYDVYLRVKQWAIAGEFTNTDQFIAAFDPNFDAMVCALYSSSSPDAGKVSLRQMLETFVLDSVSPAMKLAILSVFEGIQFELLYDAETVTELPPGYIGRECCGSVPVDNIQDVWQYTLTGVSSPYETCGATVLTETINQPSEVDVDLLLSKDGQYGGYDAKIHRDTPIGDATYFSVEFNQSGNMKAWSLNFRNEGNGLLHSVTIPQQAYTFVSVDLSAFERTSVSRVEFVRDGEIYNATCPRTFGAQFTIDTDSDDWLVY